MKDAGILSRAEERALNQRTGPVQEIHSPATMM